ncbi:MAG: hypothetical protein WAV90_13195 [Gordonia amarae]
MSASDPDDAWWSRQPDVGDFIMDAGDAAGWSSDSGWFDPIDAELGCAVVADDEDQLDLCDHAVVDSPLMHRRPWVSPLADPEGCLVLFAGQCAGDNLAWIHGGLTLGEGGGWWDGDEELIGVARRLRSRVPDHPCAIPFVIACVCDPVEDVTALLADEYHATHGDASGAVVVTP